MHTPTKDGTEKAFVHLNKRLLMALGLSSESAELVGDRISELEQDNRRLTLELQKALVKRNPEATP